MGARSEDIVRGILAYVGRLTAAGLIAGTLAGLATTRLLSSLLYGVTPLDWRTFAGVAVVVAIVALAASFLPARSAALVDPIVALRDISSCGAAA